MKPSTKTKRYHEKNVAALLTELALELRALRVLVQMPSPYVVRNDRQAARITGHRSTWRFSGWAKERGLKPLLKANSRARTIYRVRDLIAACDADIAGQKEGPP